MKRDGLSVILSLFGLLMLVVSCDSQHKTETKPDKTTDNYKMAIQSKEIVAQNVLSAQLAKHNEIESRTIFAPNEPIHASVYLTDSQHIEPRRIYAFLFHDETVIDEQSIYVGESEKRHEFNFSFIKMQRPCGTYQIRFVEITRSNGKPVLLARLFLNIE